MVNVRRTLFVCASLARLFGIAPMVAPDGQAGAAERPAWCRCTELSWSAGNGSVLRARSAIQRCRALAETERHHAGVGALRALARFVPEDRGAFEVL
jgi:hypothetical protein